MKKLWAIALLIVLPNIAMAATPSEGVPLSVRKGFFTETDLGAFLTVGGANGYSNTQSYFQLGVGYQFNFGRGSVPIGFEYGIGSNAANCFASAKTDGSCAEADNFTISFFTLNVGYQYQVFERFFMGAKLLGGFTLLEPAPVADFSKGGHVGVALSAEYVTQMDHFAIGLDVSYRMILGAASISTIQIFPRVKYTF